MRFTASGTTRSNRATRSCKLYFIPGPKDIERLDITLPVLTPRVQREHRILGQLDPASWRFRPVALRNFTDSERRKIDFKDIDLDQFTHSTMLTDRHDPTIQNAIGYFAVQTIRDLKLVGGYDVLYGKVKEFIAGNLFGGPVDLDDPDVPANLNEPVARNTTLETIKTAINALTIRDHGEADLVRMLSFAHEIRPHVVARREHYSPRRSILNYIVGDSHFELVVASFLDGCGDIISFLKNSPSTHFHIEYQRSDGVSNYYPDFLVKRAEGDIWVIETKGREDLDDPRKWARLQAWCVDAARAMAPTTYRALFVRQETWESLNPRDFGELCEGCAE